MSRYHGPRIHLIKRLGTLPGFGFNINRKFIEKKKYINQYKKKKKSPFTIRLTEKQKLRFNFGLTDKTLKRYVKQARKKKKLTSENLLNSLELRLDNIVFRLGFAPTLPAARQLVTHGHILLNGEKINIPSVSCKINDLVSLKKIPTNTNIKKSKLPKFLSIDYKNFVGKIVNNLSKDDIGLNINELLVIEYYSRNF